MKKQLKKLSVILSVLIVMQIINIFGTTQQAFAEGTLSVQMYNANRSPTSNTLSPNFKVFNAGATTVSLSNIKIRYYYTIDTSVSQNFFCDYAVVGYTNITSSVTSSFVMMPNPTQTADCYVEIGFTSAAGNLASGDFVQLDTRIAKSDWTDYNQSNDYSFNSTATNYTDWSYATAYISGSLQWGTEPLTPTPATGDSMERTYLKYEAESGTVSTTSMVINNDYCSGGQYVGNFYSLDTLNLNVSVPSAATYTVSVYYRASEEGAARMTFTQGSESDTYDLVCPGNRYVENIGCKSMDIPLNAGNYQLTLSKNQSYPVPGIDFITVSKNLAVNHDFENGSSTLPDGWNDSGSGVEWDTSSGENGSKAIRLTSSSDTSGVDVESDEIQLEPFRYYLAEVRVKPDITSTTDFYGFQGGNISIGFTPSSQQSFWYTWGTRSHGIRENNVWQTAVVNFQAPEDGIVKIRLALENAAGTALFDNVKLYPNDSMVKLEGDHIILGIEREDLDASGITSTNVARYISNYDELFEENAALTGLDPETHFAGQKLKMLSRSGLPFGGEASAHTFIWWAKDAVQRDLNASNLYNAFDWVLLHEMGHSFDREEWNFDGEFWGSFKGFAALKRLGAPLYSDGVLYYNDGSEPSFTDKFRYAGWEQFANGQYWGDYLISKLGVELQPLITWAPFTDTFEYFADPQNAAAIPQGQFGKFKLFLDKLDEYAMALGYNYPSMDRFSPEDLHVIENAYCLNNPNYPSYSTIYEAENTTSVSTNPNLSVIGNSSCSNGQYVGSVGYDNNLTFDVNTDNGGLHVLKLTYISGEDRTININIPNNDPISVLCPSTGDWNTPGSLYVIVPLQSGNNDITLENPQYWAPDIDCIQILY